MREPLPPLAPSARAILGTETLLLNDERGTLRAALETEALLLADEKGTRRVALGSYNDGPGLMLGDEKGVRRVGIGVDWMDLLDKDEKTIC